MKLTKFDIGAEIIAILTKGMYPDPRDTLREYIQNGVDAHAENIKVRIGQSIVSIEDDGRGMDHKTMRKALRVGVSDKQPGKDVGFMGIGIYSAFHLCDSLTIYSRIKENPPCKLEIDFKSMREKLEEQKKMRLEEKITSDKLIDLQTLLEKYIDLPDEGTLEVKEFPGPGTHVVLSGINPHFFGNLIDFDNVADYLKEVVPLHFDKEQFSFAKEIEKRISETCDKEGARFEIVNVELNIGGRKEKLFRPYRDEHFHNGQPQKPIFKELRDGGRLIGVVWGCLNSTRKKIEEKKLRGFLIKKQGFAIGKREHIAGHFRSRTHFDRYIGEIIVVSPELLPNASRDDFEYSPLRTNFYKSLANTASELNTTSNQFQDTTKALDDIGTFKEGLKKINTRCNRFERDPDKLVSFIVELNDSLTKINSIIRRKVLKDHDHGSEEAKKLKKSIEELIDEIQAIIKWLTSAKKKRVKQKTVDKQVKIARDLASISTEEVKEKEYQTLVEVLDDFDIELSGELVKILTLIDEKFIQGYTSSKAEYFSFLNELKEDIINSID
ncbi:MAG: ATP-binding protein [Candidatus Aminicenantes bacterium]|nr:ATP-binding protein [Candidatus Aminicenantes bacterium]